jgi:hypothetical protein
VLGNISPGVKQPDREADKSTPSRLWMRVAVPPIPHMPSWHCYYLSTGTNWLYHLGSVSLRIRSVGTKKRVEPLPLLDLITVLRLLGTCRSVMRRAINHTGHNSSPSINILLSALYGDKRAK